METHTLNTPRSSHSNGRLFWQGCVAMTPLSIAVVPWGLLAGSYAIESGLSLWESQALSAILFAGSAQLVATGMLKAGAGLVTMLITTFFITSRHLLYSVSMRERVRNMPLRWRLSLGFLLTDELFAVVGHQSEKQFNKWYALGAGLSFYLCWNAATLVGIFAGQHIPHMNELGLEFAVAATFIAIVVPNIKGKPVLGAVLTSLTLSVLCSYLNMEGGLIIASLGGMLAGFVMEKGVKS